MTKNDFAKMIDFGSDIMFNCAGRSYTILGWTTPGPTIAEQTTEANEAYFKNGITLIENYVIAGKPLEEYLDQIEITFCT